MYKSLVEENSRDMETRDALMESLRITHCRIVEDRESANAPVAAKRTRQDDGLHTPTVRNWALRQGYPLNRGRINKRIRQAYMEAHGLGEPATTEAPETPQIAPVAPETPAALVRAWCQENDVQCGARGRINPDAMRAYQEAHTA